MSYSVESEGERFRFANDTVSMTAVRAQIYSAAFRCVALTRVWEFSRARPSILSSLPLTRVRTYTHVCTHTFSNDDFSLFVVESTVECSLTSLTFITYRCPTRYTQESNKIPIDTGFWFASLCGFDF